MFVISAYVTIGLIASKSGSKKPVEIVAAAPAATGGIPDVDSPEFEAWANGEGNIEKYLSTLA